MSIESVATRYAQALFELGTEQGTLAALAQEIRRFGDTYAESAELRGVLDNPLVEESARASVLAEIASRLGVSPTAKNTVALLAQRRRLVALPLIARMLDRLSDEKAGLLRATVTSATALTDAFCDRLRAELETRTGKKIVLERAVDPSLLGGVVTRIGDQVIDGSLKTRFATMRAALLALFATLRTTRQKRFRSTIPRIPCSFAPKRSARSSRRTSRTSTRPRSSWRPARC